MDSKQLILIAIHLVACLWVLGASGVDDKQRADVIFERLFTTAGVMTRPEETERLLIQLRDIWAGQDPQPSSIANINAILTAGQWRLHGTGSSGESGSPCNNYQIFEDFDQLLSDNNAYTRTIKPYLLSRKQELLSSCWPQLDGNVATAVAQLSENSRTEVASLFEIIESLAGTVDSRVLLNKESAVVYGIVRLMDGYGTDPSLELYHSAFAAHVNSPCQEVKDSLAAAVYIAQSGSGQPMQPYTWRWIEIAKVCNRILSDASIFVQSNTLLRERG